MADRKWADLIPVVPFGGLHGSGNDKTQFERIAELERKLAARDAELATVTSVLESIKVALRRKGVSESYVDWAAYCRESVDRAERAEAELARVREGFESLTLQVSELELSRDSWKAKAEANERDAERWKKYLEIHDSEELAAASWVGALEITKTIDAARGKQ